MPKTVATDPLSQNAQFEIGIGPLLAMMFRTIRSFRGESAFTTWLRRLTVNLVLMHFRKRKMRPELTSDDEESLTHLAARSRDPKRMRIVDRIFVI